MVLLCQQPTRRRPTPDRPRKQADHENEALVTFARSPVSIYAALVSISLQHALYDQFAAFRWPTFAEMYAMGVELGAGATSVVMEALHRKTGAPFAVKLISKGRATCLGMKDHRSEIACLRTLHHPHIVNLVDYFDEDDAAYVVLELVPGGELFLYMLEHGPCTEAETKHIIKQLLAAVIYCHEHNIVHRDIKPENILFTRDPDSGAVTIKLADFGFATSVRGDTLSRRCGTQRYMAPEMLKGQTYGTSVDVWSIGIITFCLLCGFFPEIDDAGNVQFDGHISLSPAAIECVEEMLTMEPTMRSTAKEVLSHPWFSNQPPRSTGRKRTVDMFETFGLFITDMLQFVAFCQTLEFGAKTQQTLETANDGLGMIQLYLSTEPSTISSMFTFLSNVVGSLVDDISSEEPDLIPVAKQLQRTYEALRLQLVPNCPTSHTLMACI
ncbi:CAMK protein kinase [Saprolegnia parasitica CBS 223.65]|uniref:CAMK protein kinase n=1 Tax=Saprolegnia parasitica (strain CBS 223.65) TaxID=695850 RepID=A0A067C6X5_SAPPC|nr:CAMK protein kinase [Saprolegnia parasitica CBS 223.65]KDO26228.1 CAMK protein kinase [Saprolegnia parasitica CBS 223.65]|eukprot:XP_012202937.1 CAMK protein kinase [Saprolegnia parasitica CBS 223.65]